VIDLWEALGRVSSDLALQKELFEKFPKTGRLKPYDDLPEVEIATEDYTTMRNFAQPLVHLKCVSLMAAGELLMSIDSETSRKALAQLAPLIQQAQPALTTPTSTNYNIALGIAIVDEQIRAKLANPTLPVDHVVPRLPTLTTNEQANLKTLAANSHFGSAAHDFCIVLWTKGCNVKLEFWPGHLHPLGVDADQWP
jgi:hypothetical protein